MSLSSSQTGVGVILCIEKALAQSGVSREDVNYINAHATSTPAGDLKEYQSLIRCFGQNPEVYNYFSLSYIVLFPCSYQLMLLLTIFSCLQFLVYAA